MNLHGASVELCPILSRAEPLGTLEKSILYFSNEFLPARPHFLDQDA